MIYVSSKSLGSRITIYLAKKAQIVLLLVEKVTLLAKYFDFANVFLKKLSKVLPEQPKANKHII